MDIKINRNDKPEKIDSLKIYIGENRFYLKETIDGKLEIMKISESSNENITINPKVGNVIDIS